MSKNSNFASDLYDKFNEMSDRYKNKEAFAPSLMTQTILHVGLGVLFAYVSKGAVSLGPLSMFVLTATSVSALLNSLSFRSIVKNNKFTCIDDNNESVRDNINYLKNISLDKTLDLESIIQSPSKTPKSLLSSIRLNTSELIDEKLNELNITQKKYIGYVITLSAVSTLLLGPPALLASVIVATPLFTAAYMISESSASKLKTIKEDFLKESDQLLQENQDTPDYEEMVKAFENNKKNQVKQSNNNRVNNKVEVIKKSTPEFDKDLNQSEESSPPTSSPSLSALLKRRSAASQNDAQSDQISRNKNVINRDY